MSDSARFEQYKKLSDNLLSDAAKKDTRIFLHATAAIYNGLTPEETTMHSYLFDIALQANEAENDRIKMMEIFYSIAPALIQFTSWKDSGLINTELWKNDTTAIARVATLDSVQLEWLQVVLQDLNCLKAR